MFSLFWRCLENKDLENAVSSQSTCNCKIITRDDVVSQRLKFGSVFLSSSWESKIVCFFNFPVSRACPEKLCDFYWLQLQITCKSGWIAQGEKRYCVSKEGKSKLKVWRRTKTQGCALDLTAQDLGSGDLKYCLGAPAGQLAGAGFFILLIYSQKAKNV